jgi:hypothetical protein
MNQIMVNLDKLKKALGSSYVVYNNPQKDKSNLLWIQTPLLDSNDDNIIINVIPSRHRSNVNFITDGGWAFDVLANHDAMNRKNAKRTKKYLTSTMIESGDNQLFIRVNDLDSNNATYMAQLINKLVRVVIVVSSLYEF